MTRGRALRQAVRRMVLPPEVALLVLLAAVLHASCADDGRLHQQAVATDLDEHVPLREISVVRAAAFGALSLGEPFGLRCVVVAGVALLNF